MNPLTSSALVLVSGLLTSAVLSAWWLALWVMQLSAQLPASNADMVLTEHPLE
ncbi:hypothetical protein [Oryzisolibacter sp. LB2S]|uniref:hypothetical protein n=1 Tax=Alicycliphilus soli TaxID=3228789 RepID=UPI00345904D9